MTRQPRHGSDDDRLRRALRTAAPTPALAEDRERELLAAVRARAAAPLAALRRASRQAAQPIAWWELTAGWARAALPVGVAAAVLAAVTVALAPVESSGPHVAFAEAVAGQHADELAYALVEPSGVWSFTAAEAGE
jgi:anti-sigma factor RsiW